MAVIREETAKKVMAERERESVTRFLPWATRWAKPLGFWREKPDQTRVRTGQRDDNVQSISQW